MGGWCRAIVSGDEWEAGRGRERGKNGCWEKSGCPFVSVAGAWINLICAHLRSCASSSLVQPPLILSPPPLVLRYRRCWMASGSFGEDGSDSPSMSVKSPSGPGFLRFGEDV